MSATVNNHPDGVRKVFETNVDVNEVNVGGTPALSHAVRRSNLVVVKMLMDAGASPNIVNHDGRSVLDSLNIAKPDNPEIVKLLLSSMNPEIVREFVRKNPESSIRAGLQMWLDGTHPAEEVHRELKRALDAEVPPKMPVFGEIFGHRAHVFSDPVIFR